MPAPAAPPSRIAHSNRPIRGGTWLKKPSRSVLLYLAGWAHLDLAYVDLAVLLAQLLVRLRHGVERDHGIAQVLCRERGALDVEGLLRELRELRLVHALLLEGTQGPLLDRILNTYRNRILFRSAFKRKRKTKLEEDDTTLPGPLRSLLICSL